MGVAQTWCSIFWGHLRCASIVIFCIALCWLGIAVWLFGSNGRAIAQDVQPYQIAVHLSSHAQKSEDALEVKAIEAFVTQLEGKINDQGGIHGRPLDVVLFDDHLEADNTIVNVDNALELPHLIGMIGVWSSTRGAKIVDRVGASGVPFVSEMSVATLFSAYPNVYSLTRSVKTEHDVLANYSLSNGWARIGFVGAADDLYTKVYFEHLNGQHRGAGEPETGLSMASTYWLDGEIEDNEDNISRAIDDIKSNGVQMIFLSIRSEPGAKFLARLSAAGVSIPVFVGLGSVQGMMAYSGGRDYGGPLVEVAEGGIANLNNERLRTLMRDLDIHESESRFRPNHIGYGARYADILDLMVEGARASISTDVAGVRESIAAKLSGLRENQGYWAGTSQHWSFSMDRASSEHALIVWRPPGRDGSILAPMQFVKTDNGVKRVPVLYMHLDMVRVYGIDSSDKSFEAEFFFTTRSDEEVSIDAIEFTNAYRAKASKDPIINIRKINERRGDNAGRGGTKVYRVSGRFRFEPDLGRYPFDEQVLSISFQPATTGSAFFLQPSREGLRLEDFDIDGWSMREHYVGTSDLIVRSIAGPMMDPRAIPYYTFNYTWVMKRHVIDFILRVIVPLSCILITAYLAVFIPRVEFNATVAIQVTALLAAIALYFALNQPQADDATLSDLIFVVSYAIIAVMIALSIFEVNTELVEHKRRYTFVRVAQVYLVPLFAIGALTMIIAYSETVLNLGSA